MCSRLDNDDDDVATCGDCGDESDISALLPRHNRTDIRGCKCKKCGEKEAAVVLRENDTYCTSCLQLSVTHKFRSCLGKSRLMRSGERVLVAFSGGPSSALMLALVKEGLAETSHKRLRFVPYVVYIDESSIEDGTDRNDVYREIVSCARSCGFPLFVTSLEKVMEADSKSLCTEVAFDGDIDGFPAVVTDGEANRLKALFASVGSLTCKTDLLVKLRQRLVCDVAHSLKCTKVFLGDSETRIAVRVLSDIAQGKGQHLSLNCGFSDGRYKDILIVRPMREILAKEVSHCVISKQIPTVTRPTFTTKLDASASIQHLTESFVFGLQDEFPSTVSTVFRTGDKMGSSANCSKNADRKEKNTNCILCLVPIGENSSATDEVCSRLETNQSTICRCSQFVNSLQIHEIEQFFCYSCKIILNEATNIEVLPKPVIDDAVLRINKLKMREDIQPYLLDGGSS